MRSLALLFLALVTCASPRVAGTELGASPAPDFTLTDALSGRSVALSSLRGSVVALTFLYTTCPDICPITGERFRMARERLGGDAGSVRFVAVSVDPDRDTPAAVRAFSTLHGLGDGWLYLIGARPQLTPVWAAYGILASPDTNKPTITHNDAIYVIDAQGRERYLLHSSDTADDLVGALRAALRG